MRDHPIIESLMKTGHLANALDQQECEGIDFFGDEILSGDDVVIYEGEMVLRDNLDDRGKLEKFLYHFGFEFKTIKYPLLRTVTKQTLSTPFYHRR